MRTLTAAALALFVLACAPKTAAPPPPPPAPDPAPPVATARRSPVRPPADTPTAPQVPEPEAQEVQEGQESQAGARRGAPQPVIRPYDQVITKDATLDEGVFVVHRIKDRVYYEIPAAELGKDFLWVSQIAKTALGAGYGGQALGNRVVRWERRGDRVFLRAVSYDMVADPARPIALAVENANFNPILMAFNIEALGKADAPVIEVTRLFTTEIPEFAARVRVRANTFDQSRSFVERAVSFPTNIEVEAIHTFSTPATTGGQRGGGPAPQGPGQPPPARPGSASVLVHYSMVKLPEQPMTPRLFDERVGYFSVRQQDFGVDEHRAPERRYITRYRLEKKDPNAAISEPVAPIVYWIDPATPKKWVPYLTRGVEKWQAAFETAGFRNAIVAKEGPTPEQDPEWSPEDARYSVIRWLPSTIENASGPHIHDPRTGEILEADIQFYHNVMNLLRAWYFLQAGPLDARAQKLPFPDELMGTLLEYVTAHEVGHTLGFQHNMKASSTYPFEKLRDPEWLKTMGHTPTLMDYSRFNYVAQPEDRIDPALLVPGIGPYDKWATRWGYAPVPSARTPDDERKTLDAWAREQDQTPWYRFSTPGARGADPGDLTEAVGEIDAVKATELGLKNLRRVADMLMTATEDPGEPFNDLEELYGRMLGQWATELNHVSAIVGGYESQQRHWGQNGPRFTPVPRARQKAAVDFLNANAFRTPDWAIRPEVLRRIETTGVIDRVTTAQRRILASLLNGPRVVRLVEQEALDGGTAYRATDFLGDVRHGVWTELERGPVMVDPFRRNLQRAYVDHVTQQLDRSPANDSRAFFRGELQLIDERILVTLRDGVVRDRATRLHLQDVRAQIARAFDPSRTPPPSAQGTGGPGELDEPETVGCWPDYIVKTTRE